jgi:hypothetical protein
LARGYGLDGQPLSLGLKARCRPHSDSTVLKSIADEKYETGGGWGPKSDAQFWEDIFPET